MSTRKEPTIGNIGENLKAPDIDMSNIDNIYAAPKSNIDKNNQLKERLLEYKKNYRFLAVTFWAFPIMILLMYISYKLNFILIPEKIQVSIGLLVIFMSFLFYNIYLGKCARNINSTALKWVGLNIFLPAISYPCSMYMMRNRMKNIIQDIEDAIY